MNRTTTNICVIFVREHTFLFLWDGCSEVQFQGLTAVHLLLYKKLRNSFPEWHYHFVLPPAVNEFWPAIVVFIFCYFSHYDTWQFKKIFYCLCYYSCPNFSPFAFLCPASPHSQYPHRCPCPWVIHTCSLTSPFPSLDQSPPPQSPDHCTFNLHFPNDY